jgi:hypothetical protein
MLLKILKNLENCRVLRYHVKLWRLSLVGMQQPENTKGLVIINGRAAVGEKGGTASTIFA